MSASRRLQRCHADDGFTLIEVVVVFVILAILTSIAVPTLLGLRNAAENLAAQSGLRDVLFAEKAHFLVNEAYTEDPEAIRAVEPNTLLHPSDATKGVVVVFAPDTTATVCLSRASGAGTVFAVWKSTIDGTYYGSEGLWICPSTPPPGFSGAGW